MKYKVIKKFFDPFLKARVNAGDMVEVADENLDGYRNYIEIPVLQKPVEDSVIENTKENPAEEQKTKKKTK